MVATKKAPRKTGAPLTHTLASNLIHRSRGVFHCRSFSVDRLRSLLLDGLLLDGLAIADRDAAGLFRLGNLAHQIDMQQAVLELGALDLDEVGELEHALERARGDPLVKHVAALSFLLGVLVAADGEGIFLRDDRQFGLAEARDRDRYAILVLAGPLDIVGRVPGSAALDALIEQRKQPVKADGGTIKGCKIESSHGISSLKRHAGPA